MSSLLARRRGRAVVYGLLLWLVGMLVGSIVFASPQLKATPAVPFVTANPFITLPVVVLWSLLAWVMTRKLVVAAPHPRDEAVRFGVTALAINVVLDLLVVVGAMNAGVTFYSYAGLWLGYGVLVAVPWLVGRHATPWVAVRA